MDNKIQRELSDIGIINVKDIIYNPSYEDLYNLENTPDLKGLEKVQNTQFGAVNVMTGIYTGRSPKDKYILKDDTTKDNLWWTSDLSKNDNKPINTKVWNNLKKLVTDQLSNKKLYIIDAFCGANKDTCLKVRFIVEVAWQAHFVKNMFIRPSEKELKDFLEGLSQGAFTKIRKFFDTMPQLRHEVEVTNPKTGVKSKVTFKGLQDFFQ